MRKSDDVNAPMVALVGIFGALLLFVITVGIQAWIRNVQTEEEQRKVVAPPNEELVRLQAEQMEELNAYRLIDAEKGVISIPIDRAMSLVVKDIRTSATREQGGRTNVDGKNN